MFLMTVRQGMLVALMTLAMAPSVVYAASFPSAGIVPCDGPNCTVCSLATLAQNILNIGIYLAVFLSAVLFAWAGWKYLTAGGDTGEVSSAKKIFWNVAIGLIIILGAWLIVDTLVHTLTNINGWNNLCSN